MNNVLDLFCGAGGFSNGFKRVGYNIVAGVDNKDTGIDTFELNHNAKGINKDLSKVDPSCIDENINENIDVIIGGPPCKGFSNANSYNDGHDSRNTLVNVYLDFIDYFEPNGICMENVPQIKNENYPNDKYDTYGDLIKTRLDNMNYNYSFNVLNASNYGVPQNRKRAIVIGTKKDININKPEKTHSNNNDSLPSKITVSEALEDAKAEEYSNHRQKTKERMSKIDYGNNWRDIPDELKTESMGEFTHSNTYKRLHPDKPSITITNYSKSLIMPPDDNRILSVDEALKLQSFNDFKFSESSNLTNKTQMIGNSVPPKLAEEIAYYMKDKI